MQRNYGEMKLSNLVGQALDGKYLIEKQLGKGGMGAVFFATHLGTERPVAVKVIMPQYMKHDEFVERFRREARAAGRLRHPNVVDVTDFGFADVDGDRVAYLVMEYLDGCTLDEILEEEKKLPLNFTLDILEQVCSAVEEAHQQGIIHRDLKPDNIWLEPNRRGNYTVKVLDFGIAKLDGVSMDEEPQMAPVHVHSDPSADTVQVNNATKAGTNPFHSEKSLLSYQASEITESATLIHAATAAAAKSEEEIDEPEEAQTRQMSIEAIAKLEEDDEEGGTKLFDSAPKESTTNHLTAKPNETHHVKTNSVNSLTRVGSILGTPLYMSPEQCKGQSLTSRADVYSLGIIAYQMLSGKTPFEGDYKEVMKSHIEDSPQLLKVKGLRKKTARVVMSALSKDPEKRPSSAAGFASILRANSQGVGTLFQNALTLFSSHIQTFTKLSLIIFAPMIIFTFLLLGNKVLGFFNLMPERLEAVIESSSGFLTWILALLTASVLSALTTWVVAGIQAAPLKPVEIKPAFLALRRRLKPFAWTSFLVILVNTILCFLIPISAVIFALVPAVVIIEGEKGIAAMKRSFRLVRRTLRTVIANVCIQFLVPFFLTTLIFLIIGSGIIAADTVIKKVRPETTSIPQTLDTKDEQNKSDTKNKESKSTDFRVEKKNTGVGIFFGEDDGDRQGKISMIMTGIFQLVWLPINVVLGTFAAILIALLYLKARQAGGETIKEVLQEFDDECQKRSKWQKKMRNRLSLHTRVSKS